MNFDINVLRIFEDCIKDLSGRNDQPEVIAGFRQEFRDVRKEIDDLRHEMHLHKMTLATISRNGKQLNPETYEAGQHDALKKRYLNFRQNIEKLKIEFINFENKWMN